METGLKKLPITNLTKKRIVEMYISIIPEKTVSEWIRDIQKKQRNGYFNRFSRNLTLKEWISFVDQFGEPPGYRSVFMDDETISEKANRD